MNRVFILGAGASKNAQAPATREIIPLILKQKTDLNEEPLRISTISLHILTGYLKEIRNHDYLKTLDVEELLALSFSPVFLDILLGWDVQKIKNFQSHLQWGIIYIIEQGIQKCNNFEPYELFREFIDDNDAIISLNYDLIFEFILLEKLKKINYFLNSDLLINKGQFSKYLEGKFPFLKLHGSMNLSYCDKCQNFSLSDPSLAVFTEDPNIGRIGNYKFGCPSGDGGNLISAIIPPGAEKSPIFPVLIPVWKKAFELLKNADEIYFIGVSFRENDIYFRHLICGSLCDNKDVKITYIGNELTPERKDRLSNLLNISTIKFIDGGFGKWMTTFYGLIRFY